MLKAVANFFSRTDPQWIKYSQEAERKAQFTPDAAELQQQWAVNVFIYNECQMNGPKTNILGDKAIYGGLAYTESSDFVLYKKDLGKETFPFALEVNDDNRMGMSSLIGDPGQIMGEVYSVRPYDLISLDNYMLNTVRFERKRVKVVIPWRPNASEEIEPVIKEVWMYVGKLDFWKDQIYDQEMKKFFKPSPRLFCAKENNNKDTLGAHYLFDYNLEANSK